MLNSGKKFRALRDKINKYSNSCVDYILPRFGYQTQHFSDDRHWIDVNQTQYFSGDRHWVDVNQIQHFSGDRHWVDVNQTQHFSDDRH
jgi:hypothetical protein